MRRKLCFTILAVAILGIVVMPLVAGAETSKWRQTLYVNKIDKIDVGDVPGHIVGVAEGGGVAFFENGDIATYWWKGTIDYTKGAGTSMGYMLYTFEDESTFLAGALAALQKCVEQDKAVAVVGPFKSTQVFAMSDAIKNYRIPVMIGATNANLTRKGNPWLFRCRPDDSIAAAAMVKFIKEDLKLTRMGILHDTDAFGTGGADLVEQNLKESGVTLVKREKYTTKDKDFTPQLLSLKNAGAQVMVVYGTNPEVVAVIQRQLRQLGSPYKYLGSLPAARALASTSPRKLQSDCCISATMFRARARPARNMRRTTERSTEKSSTPLPPGLTML